MIKKTYRTTGLVVKRNKRWSDCFTPGATVGVRPYPSRLLTAVQATASSPFLTIVAVPASSPFSLIICIHCSTSEATAGYFCPTFRKLTRLFKQLLEGRERPRRANPSIRAAIGWLRAQFFFPRKMRLFRSIISVRRIISPTHYVPNTINFETLALRLVAKPFFSIPATG